MSVGKCNTDGTAVDVFYSGVGEKERGKEKSSRRNAASCWKVIQGGGEQETTHI
jgi:hypothetical protein